MFKILQPTLASTVCPCSVRLRIAGPMMALYRYIVLSTALLRLYPDLVCHCRFPSRARDRMFRLRSFKAATAGFTCAFFFGGMITRGERLAVWLSMTS